ncbi:MAG: hypothetical protein IPK60_07800 [Sandaracinaceae bacterium]|nr:hypothetical protein [Sandaracinaceae bacterium]
MTDQDLIEAELAEATRAWLLDKRPFLASQDYSPLEGRFAAAIESWVATFLHHDPRSDLRGRWYDGFVIRNSSARSASDFHADGYIWALDSQRLHPVDVSFTLKGDAITHYLVRFGDQRAIEGAADATALEKLVVDHPEWRFTYSKE